MSQANWSVEMQFTQHTIVVNATGLAPLRQCLSISYERTHYGLIFTLFLIAFSAIRTRVIAVFYIYFALLPATITNQNDQVPLR
jgi:hypothetical protein